jgi:hypothetical protein
MPVQVVMKKKTESQTPGQHKKLVPLQVSEIKVNCLREPDHEKYKEYIDIGDILTVLPDPQSHLLTVFNCSRGTVLASRYYDNGGILCVRAYEVAQVVICNDNEPAPVI